MQTTDFAGCKLVGIAGSGGFATTYFAKHRDWGDVAVKILSPNWAQNADVARRFELECETLEAARPSTDDPLPAHVSGYFAHGQQSGAPYLITEFCAGASLEQRLADLPDADRVPVALWVLRAALPGLSYIHNKLGVVHRDLSPGNLLLRTVVNADDQLLIADFGMLKQTALQSNLSHVMGTAGYAAPEVRSLGVCDARSDVYSLGVLSWEILTGQSADVTTTFTRDSFPPQTPDDVVELVLQMIRDERDDRPFVDDVTESLRQITSPEPAMPPPLVESFVTPLTASDTNHRQLALGALIAAAGGLAAVGGFLLVQETEFTAYEPSGRGTVIELTDDWETDTPASEAVFFQAINADRQMNLSVAPLGATDVTAAIELVAGTLDEGAETLDSVVLENGVGSLLYTTEGGIETQVFVVEQSCGTVLMSINDPDGFDSGDLDHVAQIGERFRAVDQPVLPDRELPAPDGFITFSLNGVALAAPDSYYRIDSPNHCLFVLDDTPEHTRSIAINYYPAADVDDVVNQLQSVFEQRGLTQLDESTTADGFPRLHVSDDASEFVIYFVSDGSGVYTVQASEFLELPFTPSDLDAFDQVIGTFRVIT